MEKPRYSRVTKERKEKGSVWCSPTIPLQRQGCEALPFSGNIDTTDIDLKSTIKTDVLRR